VKPETPPSFACEDSLAAEIPNGDHSRGLPDPALPWTKIAALVSQRYRNV